MEDLRSKSCGDRRMQIERYDHNSGYNPTPVGLQDLRCHSAYYESSSNGHPPPPPPPPQTQMEIFKDAKLKKVKSRNGSSMNWSLNDPELQRKKRVASYKVYTVEGKVKGSLRKSFRWLKDRYTKMVYGWG